MGGGRLELAYIGDLILQAPNAIGYFDCCREALAGADVRVAQVEWPHTARGQVSAVYIPAPALHKGLGLVHAQLAQYERPLARAAIDAGADVVIGHHAHMLRGVEVYRGKPIFHGINHFVTAYDPSSNPRSASGESARPHPSRLAPGALPVPDASVRDFPYSRESRHTMIARVVVDGDGIAEAGFTPCWIDELARPVAHGRDAEGESTVGYLAAITKEAGLEAELAWDGDRVVFFRR